MARQPQAVTIKHVAAHAGVSLQTVSRVINDGPNVRAEMRERVQKSIDELGYVPSIAAQRMSGSRSYLILALNDRERTISGWVAREGTDWVDQMLLGGMLTCAKHGYRLMFELIDTHSDHVQRELKAAIAALQPDGVILTPPHSENPLITEILENLQIPFTRIGSRITSSGIAVTMGDDAAASMATRHLLELGHRRIGMIAGPLDYAVSQWRVDGWVTAMKDAGLPIDGLISRGDFGYDSGEVAARELLRGKARPTAIIASSDQMALAANDVARGLGLDVPGDLSIVSFDNTPIVRFGEMRFTAIDQPIAKAASVAVDLLVEAKRSGDQPSEPTVVSATLVKGASTGPAPAETEQRARG